jgi:3-dehydroquinate synthase class II
LEKCSGIYQKDEKGDMMQPINKMDKKMAKKYGKEHYKVEFVVEEQDEAMAKSYVQWLLNKNVMLKVKDWKYVPSLNLKKVKLTKVT